MISWFRTRLQRMSLGGFLPLVLFMACIAISLAYVAVLNANPDQNFWFVPALPVPPYATHIERYSGSLPGSRTIRFETDQPAEKIRQFYGWNSPNVAGTSCVPPRNWNSRVALWACRLIWNWERPTHATMNPHRYEPSM